MLGTLLAADTETMSGGRSGDITLEPEKYNKNKSINEHTPYNMN